MSDENLHIHCTEITGIMGVSEYRKDLPCTKCDWGHPPAEKSIHLLGMIDGLRSAATAVASGIRQNKLTLTEVPDFLCEIATSIENDPPK